jgi:hypothetical protein
MAAVTQLRRRVNVVGSRRKVMATLNIAANGNTYVTGLHLIEMWSATGNDSNGIGGTVSGGTVTFAVANAENPAYFSAEGF